MQNNAGLSILNLAYYRSFCGQRQTTCFSGI